MRLTTGVREMLSKLLLVLLSIFVATAAAAQGTNYKIRPGDTLGLEVLEDSSLNRQLLVLPDGTISVPLAGTIKASGLTVGQLKSAITQGLASNFVSKPTVYVSVQSLAKRAPTSTGRTISVFLLGEVTKPGEQKVAAGTTVLQFLAQSGGFTRFAAKKRLQLRRTDRNGKVQVYTINYRNIERGRDVQIASTVLQSGDVIVVPERGLFE